MLKKFVNGKISKRAGLLAAVVAVAACGLSISGVLSVHQNFSLQKKRLFGRVDTYQVPAGRYNARIDIERDKIELRLVLGGETHSFDFKTNARDIPTNGTWVKVRADQAGQAMDISAKVLKTVDVEDEIHRDWESCTYQDCHTYCDRDGNCRQHCTTRNGDRRVEYRYVHTYWDTDFKLHPAGSNSRLASFAGDRHDITRDYLYRGACR